MSGELWQSRYNETEIIFIGGCNEALSVLQMLLRSQVKLAKCAINV